MSEEMKEILVKEILNDMKSVPSDGICGLGLGEKQCKLLLNYITNLQKENEQLRTELNTLKMSEEEWLGATLGGDE